MRQNSAAKFGFWLSAALLSAAFFCIVVNFITNWVDHGTSDSVSGMAQGSYWAGLFQVFLWGGLIISLFTIITYIKSLNENSVAMIENLGSLIAAQTQVQAILTNMNENLLLSDDIKSIAFREKDRQVLESAIQQDIRMDKWQSAEWLIGRMENRFGYNEDAQRLRNELLEAQSATLQDKITSQIEAIHSLHMIHHFTEAQQREDDLLNIYPDNELVKKTKGQTERLRQEHKKELLLKLNTASRNNDLEQGVEILKLLDSYLTPTEAEALKESARDVFRARLHNMGIQFSLFVSERAWDKAIRVGQEIIEEYPNSRMAQEVREKMEILRQKIH